MTFFFAISLVFWSNHQHLTHPEPCILLCLPCLWEQPKFATDTELITTDLVQCAYPQTTRSSAALESSRPSESWMWLGTKDVALKICSNYSELDAKFYFLINKAIHGVTKNNAMLKIENLVPRNWRNVKTHNLICGIKSEDTYRYVPDYTKTLTCIVCHIGLLLVGVIVYEWTFFLTTKTLGIDTEIVFLCCSVARLLDTLYFGDYANSF